MSASKTARASQVKDRTVKSVIPDADLIRSLRIDRESGLYPGVQGTDALLRAYDDLFSESAFQHTEYQNAINAKNDRIKILEDGAAEQQEKITRLTTRLQQLDDEVETLKANGSDGPFDSFEEEIAETRNAKFAVNDPPGAVEESEVSPLDLIGPDPYADEAQI